MRKLTAGTGYTVIEVIVTIVLMVTMAVMLVPKSTKALGDSEVRVAKGKRDALNIATSTYVTASGISVATSSWPADDESRFALIKPFLGVPATTLASYTPKGFTIILGGTPLEPVQLLDKSGTVIPY